MIRIFLLILLFSGLLAQAQQVDNITYKDDIPVLYRKEASGGLNIHTNGFGLTFRKGWHKTGYTRNMLDIEFVSMRHPKQYKLANQYFDNSKPFFFGKLNFAYMLRGGYGQQKILFSKGERSGVEVRYSYYVGASLGITKPVYLEVIVPYDTIPYTITKKYDPNDPLFQSPIFISGPGPYFEGFNQLKIYPGGYAKFGVSFEYAGWHDKITAIEVGIVADAHPKAIPIMAENPTQGIFNNRVLVNFYINLLWGKKW